MIASAAESTFTALYSLARDASGPQRNASNMSPDGMLLGQRSFRAIEPPDVSYPAHAGNVSLAGANGDPLRQLLEEIVEECAAILIKRLSFHLLTLITNERLHRSTAVGHSITAAIPNLTAENPASYACSSVQPSVAWFTVIAGEIRRISRDANIRARAASVIVESVSTHSSLPWPASEAPLGVRACLAPPVRATKLRNKFGEFHTFDLAPLITPVTER